MKQDKRIPIEFGALAQSISTQLGIKAVPLDNDADAITRLHVRGLLTDSETDKARKRLMKKIVECIKDLL